jgi:hypothetical protein
MCGIKPHSNVKLDGFDQSRTLIGDPSPRDSIYCHFPHGTPDQAEHIPGFLPGTYVRKGDWKLIRFFADSADGEDRYELYDLKNDVGETKNLASEKPELVVELNELINGFLKDTQAVVPIRNSKFSPAGEMKSVEKRISKPSKAIDEEFPGLEGWKARGFTFVKQDGIVTITPTNQLPFMGIASAVIGPATFKFRVRCAKEGEGKIEWLKVGTEKTDGNAPSTTYTIKGGEWQDLSVSIPAAGALGVLRLYFPVQSDSLEIDWIELQGDGAKKRWDF